MVDLVIMEMWPKGQISMIINETDRGRWRARP